MGGFMKALGQAIADQISGSIKYGASTSVTHNIAAAKAARDEREARERRQNHQGGFGEAQYGSIDGRPVTFALGWGTKEGHTLLASGHVNKRTFFESSNHDHYGPGQGPNMNGTRRGRYTGPNS